MTTERPIGGEMEILPTHLGGESSHTPWPDWGMPSVIRCDTGRSALRCAISDWRKRGGSGQIWLPHYLCDGVFRAAEAEALTICFYEDFPSQPASKFSPPLPQPGDLVLIVHYFGVANQGANGWLRATTGRSWLAIEDCVQAPYTVGAGGSADYTFASLRKWWPAPDGAVLASRMQLNLGDLWPVDEAFVSQRAGAQMLRGAGQNEQLFLDWIEQSESKLETSVPRRCSWLSEHLLQGAQVSEAIARRRGNWLRVHDLLRSAKLGWLDPLYPDLGVGDCPLIYPIRVRSGSRDALRDWLKRRRIFCPVHWPLSGTASKEARILSAEILGIPVDQRYEDADMLRVVSALSEYSEGFSRV